MDGLPKPYYEDEARGIVIYHADCREVLPHLPKVDLLLTDPPYPNNAGHFLNGIETARWVIMQPIADHAFVFWDDLDRPICLHPLVAVHIWHRTNTNRPDNYEPIYEFHKSGARKSSRVFPYPVISLGLTGCHEATPHPTQKPVKLISELVCRSKAQTVLDPFMGSGTTLVACKQLGRRCIGIELEEKYCEIAARRLSQDLLFEPEELASLAR